MAKYRVILETKAVVKKEFAIDADSMAIVKAQFYPPSPHCLGLHGDCHDPENGGWDVESIHDVDLNDVTVKIEEIK